MTPLNGHSLADPPPIPEPAPIVARGLYESQMEDDDLDWDELPDDARESFTAMVVTTISLHMGFLAEHGFRILPPDATLRPKTDEEAAMMTEAVRLYGEAKKRKSALLTGERKLILPPGGKLQ